MVEGVAGVDGPGGIVSRRPLPDWAGDGGTAGFWACQGETVVLSGEGGGGNFSISAVSCAVCTKLLCLANFLA